MVAPLYATDAATTDKPVIMVVIAHPDDHIYVDGTLLLAMQRGYDVRIVSATSSDKGKDKTGRGRSGAELAKVIETNHVRSLNRLGIEAPSVLLRLPDGHLWDEREEFAKKLAVEWEKINPEIVITFGLDGIYGHQDHTTAGLITSMLYDKFGTAKELYYVAYPQSFVDKLWEIGGRTSHQPVADNVINLEVDISKVLDQKLYAMTAYETQFTESDMKHVRSLYDAYPAEYFIRARIAKGRTPTFPN